MKRFLLRLLLIFVGLCLAEASWRFLLLIAFSGYDAESNRTEVATRLAAMGAQLEQVGDSEPGSHTRRTFLHPYFGYETTEGHESTAWQVNLARELKGTREAKVDSTDVPFTVLVLGGSVARIFADPGKNGGTIALAETLAAGLPELERSIAVLGHGRESFKQPQQVMLLAYFFALGLSPDVVVNLDGFNEVGIGLLNPELGLHPLFPSQAHWGQLLGINDTSGRRAEMFEEVTLIRARARRTAKFADEMNLHASAILGSALQFYLKGAVREWTTATSQFTKMDNTDSVNSVSSGLPFEMNEAERLEVIVDSWVESSSMLNAMCEERDIVYLHVLQPTLHDRGSKNLTEAELIEGAALPTIEKGVGLGYPMMRAAIPRLTERGVAFLDASGIFGEIEERVYYDLCHFNRPGTEMLGDAIGRALIDPIKAQLKAE